MSTRRPDWWPLYGDPVYCPIRKEFNKQGGCMRYACVMGYGYVCEERNNMALEPMDAAPQK